MWIKAHGKINLKKKARNKAFIYIIYIEYSRTMRKAGKAV